MKEYKSKYKNYKNKYLNLNHGKFTGGMMIDETEIIENPDQIREMTTHEEIQQAYTSPDRAQLRKQKLLDYVEMFREQLKECESFKKRVEVNIRIFDDDKKIKSLLKRKLTAVIKQIKLMNKSIKYSGSFPLTYNITSQIHYLILERDIIRMEDKMVKKWDRTSRTRRY
jgi:hypothetical protein